MGGGVDEEGEDDFFAGPDPTPTHPDILTF